VCQDDVRRKRNQFRRVFANSSDVARRPADLDAHVLADAPARLLQSLLKRAKPRLKFRIIRRSGQDHADPSHAVGLLRMNSERQCGRQTGNNSDEISPPHITPRIEDGP